MTNLHIHNELSPKDRGDLMSTLRSERLWVPTSRDYPRHKQWLDSTEAAIADGSKQAFLARIDGESVGAIVYRSGDDDEGIMDIRNISITPTSRGRLLGSFMLRQVEVGAKQQSAEAARVDTKIGNGAMIEFLESNGYGIEKIAYLYDDGTDEDVVLMKAL